MFSGRSICSSNLTHAGDSVSRRHNHRRATCYVVTIPKVYCAAAQHLASATSSSVYFESYIVAQSAAKCHSYRPRTNDSWMEIRRHPKAWKMYGRALHGTCSVSNRVPSLQSLHATELVLAALRHWRIHGIRIERMMRRELA